MNIKKTTWDFVAEAMLARYRLTSAEEDAEARTKNFGATSSASIAAWDEVKVRRIALSMAEAMAQGMIQGIAKGKKDE